MFVTKISDFVDYIQPILLPTANLVDYSVVVALGWGQTSDGKN